MRRYWAEGIGTFALVFFGTGAVAVDQWTGGNLGHLGISMAFGLVVMVMIYAFGPVSGAHINPAVSIAFAVVEEVDRKDVLGYVTAQMIGALLAALLLRYFMGSTEAWGVTLPAISLDRAFFLEVLLTYVLMVVILWVSQDVLTQAWTGVAVGGTVLLEALVAGPLTGASMNPARSLGPALVGGVYEAWWLYVVAPILGAVLASWTWRWFRAQSL